MTYHLVQQQAEALKGYNEGFQKATENFEFLITVLFISQVVQIATYRLLHRTERDLTANQVKALEIVNTTTFTVALAISGLLLLQVLGIPMYSFQVKN